MTDQQYKSRKIKSYVLRAGRLTAGQRRALEEYWPRYGLDPTVSCIDLQQIFGRTAPVTVEIGFGNGDILVDMAIDNPDQDFIGIEVHEPGVGHCLLRAAESNTSNLRVIRHDAVEVLEQMLPDSSIARVNLFFPDPWHKKRHHKRRIVQPDFVQLLTRKLQTNGIFHVATDWPNYAEHIAEIMANQTQFEMLDAAPDDRGRTRFDQRGEKLGHRNWEKAWCNCSKNQQN